VLYRAIYVAGGEPPPSRDVVFLPPLARCVQGRGRPTDVGFPALDAARQVTIGAVDAIGAALEEGKVVST